MRLKIFWWTAACIPTRIVIHAILNVEKGDSRFAVDPASAKAQLERISWIKTAQVERRLPDTVAVSLTERVPVALWQKDRKLSVVDAQGVVLSDQNLEGFRDLLLVVGEGAAEQAQDLITYLAAEPVIAGKIEAAVRVQTGGGIW